jgi:hypothetical protein
MNEENIYMRQLRRINTMAFFIAMDNAQDNPSPIIIPALDADNAQDNPSPIIIPTLDDDRLRRITRPNFFRIDNTGGGLV